MNKGKRARVQRLAGNCGERALNVLGQRPELGLEAAPVKGIANQRMADMYEVHAHLMGTSRLQPAFEQGGDRLQAALAAPVPEAFEHPVMGNGSASLAGQHGHLGAACGVAADGRVDGSLRAWRRTPDKRQIATLKLTGAAVIGELLAKRPVGEVILGDDEEAARVLVEAMDDAGPRHAAAIAALRAKYPQYERMELDARLLIHMEITSVRSWGRLK